MTFYYIPLWRNVTDEVENANQRIQDDTFRFSRIIESLGMQAAEAAMTLVAFIPILWNLSKGVNIPFIKDVPGSLVWLSLAVSVGGMTISWFVGTQLPRLEYNNQKVEATYRAELVLGEKINKASHATPEIIAKLFRDIKHNYHRLFLHYGYFDVWRGSFSQFMVIVPYLVMAPSLFGGLITLGILRQVANSFDQVRSSFSLFINNWTTITELRSIKLRLKEFEDNLERYQIAAAPEESVIKNLL